MPLCVASSQPGESSDEGTRNHRSYSKMRRRFCLPDMKSFLDRSPRRRDGTQVVPVRSCNHSVPSTSACALPAGFPSVHSNAKHYLFFLCLFFRTTKQNNNDPPAKPGVFLCGPPLFFAEVRSVSRVAIVSWQVSGPLGRIVPRSLSVLFYCFLLFSGIRPAFFSLLFPIVSIRNSLVQHLHLSFQFQQLPASLPFRYSV